MSKFDPRPLFDALPSIYRNYYGDRDVMMAVYEGLLRIQDADYSSLFTTDDNKSLASAAIFTEYPVVYEELKDWRHAEVPHSHVKLTLNFDSTTSNYLGGTTQYYRVQASSWAFKNDVILYLDGRVVPPFLYTKSFDPFYVMGGAKVYGTTFYIDAQKIHDYLSGRPITTSGWQNGIAEGQEQVWPPIAEVQKVSIYSFDAAEYVSAVGDGETKEFTFTNEIDPLSSVAFIESVDITNSVTISSSGSSVLTYVLTGKTPLRLLDGQKVKIVFDDDSVIYAEARNNSVTVLSSAVIDSVSLPINFKLGNTYKITSTDITLSQGNQFVPGGRLRVVDRLGAQSITINAATNQAKFNRQVDPLTAKITYFGVDITGVTLTANALVLSSALPAETELIVRGAIVNDHSHAELSATLTTPADSAEFVAAFVAGSEDGGENINFPTRVFFDELLAIPDVDYSITGPTTITFTETLPAGTKITVRYDSDEDAFLHKHQHKTFFTSEPTANNTTFILDSDADPDNIEIALDASTLHEKDRFSLSLNRTIRFNDPVTSGVPITIHAIARPWKFSHIIADRADSEYGYRGRIKRIGSIQDGLTEAENILTSTDFELVEENDEVVLYSNTEIENAWLFGVAVDESALSKVWGELIDFKRASSQQYLDTLTALITALRAPATTDNIVNFGSVILGSRYLPEAGTSLGITQQDNTEYVRIDPTDPDSPDLLVEVLPDAPNRIRDRQVMPRLYAVNALITAFEKENLANVPWLAFFAKELSDTYQYAKRLDAGFFNKFTSRPNFYLAESQILTDYSVDFITQEVNPGTLFKVVINTIEVIDGVPTFSPVSCVMRASKVINRNQVALDFVYPEDAELFDPRGVGFGQGGFGEGAYGGIEYVPQITTYTAWTRRTRRVDIGYFLDHALSSDQALVSGEDAAELTAQLAQVLKHNSFALEINSNYITSETALEGLRKLILENRPAETKAFIYSVVDTLSEEFDVQFTEDTLVFSPANTDDGDEFAAGQSYFGSQFVARNDGTTLLYDTDLLNPGPVVFAVTPGPVSPPVANRYLIVADRDALLGFDSSFANLYSSEHGLEGKILRTSASGNSIIYKASAPLGLRNNRFALYLNQDRTVTTDPVVYDGGELTVRTIVNVDANTHSPSESPVLFQFSDGKFKLGLIVENNDTFTPFFSANGISTYAESSVSFSPGSAVFLTGTYRQIGNYWRTSIFVNGVFRGISALPASPGLTAVSSFVQSAILGAASPSPSNYHYSSSAIFDETIVSSAALTSPQILSIYNGGDVRWSSPMGYGASGSPLKESDALIVYHYDTDLSRDRILDYSGFGYNGTKHSINSEDSSVWHVAGYVRTPLASDNDIHDVAPEGFYVDPLRSSTTTSYGDGEGGPLPYVAITSLFRDVRVELNPINVSFIFNSDNESWTKTTTNQLIPGAAAQTLETNALFTGFTSGQMVGPDGETYGQSSPVTIAYGATQISFTANNSGSITSLQFAGVEYLSIANKGMNFQEKWDLGNYFTLCEAGAATQSPNEPSYSRFILDESNSFTHKSRTYVAYSSPYLYDGDLLECSANIFSRRTRLNYLNNPKIVEISSLFSLYESVRANAFSWLISLCLTDDFDTVYYFNVGSQGLSTNTPVLRQILSPGEFELIESTAKGGVIVTTSNGSKAFGLYQHGGTDPSYHLQTFVKSETDPVPHTLFIFREHNMPGTGVAPSRRARERFACVGTFGDVVGAFQQIYNFQEGIPLGSIGSSAVYLAGAYTALPNPLYINSPFSISVTAVTSAGFADSAYQAPVSISLLSGTGVLSGTTSTSFVDGEASFSNLSLNTVGQKALIIQSGSLTPSVLDLLVDAKAPTLLSINPTVVVEDLSAPFSAYGLNFEATSRIELLNSGVVLSELSPALVSPGQLNFTFTSTQLANPGQYGIRVMTPGPGGGSTGIEYFRVSPAITIAATDLVVSSLPQWVVRGSTETVLINAFDSINNQFDTGATGTVSFVRTSPLPGYEELLESPAISTSTMTNGSAAITIGPFNGNGLFKLKFTHSGGLATVWSNPIGIYNPDPVLSSLSPNLGSPGSSRIVTVRGDGFTSDDTVIKVNGQNRVTNILRDNLATVRLLPADLATPGQLNFNAETTFTVGQLVTANTPGLTVSSSSNVLPFTVVAAAVVTPVFSPHYLKIDGGLDVIYAGRPFTRSVRVVSSPSNNNASYSTGLIKFKASPRVVGLTGFFSASRSPENSARIFSPVINDAGSYLLSATHSPQPGSNLYRSASEIVTVFNFPSALISVNPVTFSPNSASLVCNVYGNNFTSGDSQIYWRQVGSSTLVNRATTFVSPSRLSFTLSPKDFSPLTGRTNFDVSVVTANAFSSDSTIRQIELTPATTVINVPSSIDFEGGGAYPTTYVLYPSPVNRSISFQASGINSTGIKKIYIKDQFGQVATAATGNIRLRLSPSPMLGVNDGTVYTTGWVPVISGFATFSPNNTFFNVKNPGGYRWVAKHSPTSGTAAPLTYSANVVTIARVLPTITAIAPSSAGLGESVPYIDVTAGNVFGNSSGSLFPGKTTALINGQPRTLTVLSPKGARLSPTPVDLTVGSRLITLKQPFAAVAGSFGSDYTSNSALFSVSGSALAEENLPATIIVSPLGAKRVLRLVNNVITPVNDQIFTTTLTGSGSSALKHAIRNIVGKVVAPSGTGSVAAGPQIPTNNTYVPGYGATDVLEIRAGYYEADSLSFSAGNSVNCYGRPGQPVIIRGKKTGGVAEPVVIAKSGDSMIIKPSLNPFYDPSYIHFYDLIIRSGNRAGVFYDYAYNLNNSANPSENGRDLLFKDHRHYRVHVAGHYDRRVVQLTPKRTLISTVPNSQGYLSANKSWNEYGQLIQAPTITSANRPFYSLDFKPITIHRAQWGSEDRKELHSYAASVACYQPIAIPAVALDVNYRLNYTFDSVGTPTWYLRLYAVPLGTAATTEGGAATGAALYSNIEYQNSNGVWTSIGISEVAKLSSHSPLAFPLSGKFAGGVAQYPNIRFTKPGLYSFVCQLVNNSTGEVIPFTSQTVANGTVRFAFEKKNIIVNVSSPGISQAETTLAKAYYDDWNAQNFAGKNIDLPSIPIYQDTVRGFYRTARLNLPVIATMDYDSSVTSFGYAGIAPMVNATLSYRISTASYNAGWRWGDATGYTLPPPNPSSPGTIVGIMRNGFGAVYTDRIGGSVDNLISTNGVNAPTLLYIGTGAPTQPTIEVSKRSTEVPQVTLSGIVYYTVPLTTVTTAAAVDAPPRLSTPPTTQMTFANQLTPYGLPNYRAATAGRVWMNGWPSPLHPNYPGLRFMHLYPHPSTCPGIVYNSSVYADGKWGYQIYGLEFLGCYGGTVRSIGEEHGFYTHECKTLEFEDMLISDCGRTNIQVHYRRYGMPPLYSGRTSLGNRAANPFNQDNTAPYGHYVKIKNCSLEDAGLKDGAVAISVAEYGSDVFIEDNKISAGYDLNLRHHLYWGTTGIICYGGGQFKTHQGSYLVTDVVTNTQLSVDKFDGFVMFDPFLVTNTGQEVLDQLDITEFLQFTLTPSNSNNRSYWSNTPNVPNSQTGDGNYLWKLLAPYPALRLSDGTTSVGIGNSPKVSTSIPLSNPKHAHRNRAYGHPLFSDPTYGRRLTLLKPNFGYSNEVNQTVVMGSPTIGMHYGGRQQIGNVAIKNNEIKINRWGSSWGSAPTMPSGTVTAYRVFGTVDFTQGAGTKAVLQVSSVRDLLLQDNKFYGGNSNPFVINQVGSGVDYSAPCLVLRGYNNQFNQVTMTYFGHAPRLPTDQGYNAANHRYVNALDAMFRSATLVVPPSPNV